MTRPLATFLFALVLVGLGAGSASAILIPYVGQIVFSALEEASILIAPDGGGPPLTQAQAFGGSAIDASIAVQIVDIWFNPVAYYPGDDIWIQFDAGDGTVKSCHPPSGSWEGLIFPADQWTDADGWTHFVLPLRGGGWTEGPATIYLAGTPAEGPDGIVHPPVPLRANSPDLNGDLVVNLSDIAPFIQDLYAGYTYRSDLSWDGVINLVDIARFVAHLGVECE